MVNNYGYYKAMVVCIAHELITSLKHYSMGRDYANNL